jgi:hypothetical protein
MRLPDLISRNTDRRPILDRSLTTSEVGRPNLPGMNNALQTIGVIGAGTLGSGIAQVGVLGRKSGRRFFACSGFFAYSY